MTNIDDKKELKKDESVKQDVKDQEELIREFIQNNTKELEIPVLPETLKKEIFRIIKELEKIKLEIVQKKESFINQYKSIEEKLEFLTHEKQVTLNEEDYKKSKETFAKYENYLNHVLEEVSVEYNFYEGLIAEKPASTIKVFKNVTDNAIEYLNSKLRESKKYIKNMVKNLRISFSRYNVGFEEQLRKLDYLKSYLKSIKKNKN